MILHRRNVLGFLSGALATPFVVAPAKAQVYPGRPVRIVVPFAAGGQNDILSRLLAQSLSERLGQPFVVENRPGAGGNLGTDAVVKASPDGYTLLNLSTTNAINVTLYRRAALANEIAPVAGLMQGPNVIVINPAVPAKTLPEFIAYAKANPGKINMASGGHGTPGHVCGELFKMMAGVDIVHVPYRGALPALTDLIAGQVQVYFVPTPAVLEYIRSGKLRALAVTSARRSDTLPDVPSVSDFVPNYEATTWQGVGAPRKTPAEIINRLNKEINAILFDPKINDRLVELGGSVFVGSPENFTKLVVDETTKWSKVVEAAGIKPT